MDERPHSAPSDIIPDMPPSRPTWKLMIGAVLVVLTIAVLFHEHQLAAMLGI